MKINPVNSNSSFDYASKAASNTQKGGKISFALEQKMNMMKQNTEQIFNLQVKNSNRDDSWQTRTNSKGNGYGYPSDDFFRQIKSIMEDGSLITPEMVAEAKANIADGGYWGSEAVSDRLVDLAVKMSKRDPALYEMLKGAITAGYKAAEGVWGGSLPDICKKTYDLTMQKLEAAFKPAEETKTESSEKA